MTSKKSSTQVGINYLKRAARRAASQKRVVSEHRRRSSTQAAEPWTGLVTSPLSMRPEA